MKGASGARNPNCWPDRLSFEWPWVRGILLLSAVPALVLAGWQSSIVLGMVSACCACLCGLAIGFRVERKSRHLALPALAAAAAAGLLLPASAVQAIWTFIALLLGAVVAGLRWYFPYRAQIVRAGDKYSIAGIPYEMADIKIKSPRIFYIQPELLEQIIGLAAYANDFLSRHGIQYVMCYGTLLGAVRHKGPMPWDDDVDFTIYRPQDIQKLEESFAELAAAAAEDGYRLFTHNDYWKLARKGFWRYPVVDLYRASIYQPVDTVPQRAAWGPLMLSVPDNAVKHLVDYYGQESLSTAVFDIPYWDSGFVPAAATRLFGIGFANLAGETYERFFGRS